MLGGALIVPVTGGLLDASATGLPQGQATPACDFQASFMTWDVRYRDDPQPYARHNIPHGKRARIQIDAIIDVIQAATGDSERFVLIAPCRMEWVYAEDHLF